MSDAIPLFRFGSELPMSTGLHGRGARPACELMAGINSELMGIVSLQLRVCAIPSCQVWKAQCGGFVTLAATLTPPAVLNRCM